jgi:hypothetical protein
MYAITDAGAAELAAKRPLAESILADAADAARAIGRFADPPSRPRCCMHSRKHG